MIHDTAIMEHDSIGSDADLQRAETARGSAPPEHATKSAKKHCTRQHVPDIQRGGKGKRC